MLFRSGSSPFRRTKKEERAIALSSFLTEGLERAAPVGTLVQKLRAGEQILARGRVHRRRGAPGKGVDFLLSFRLPRCLDRAEPIIFLWAKMQPSPFRRTAAFGLCEPIDKMREIVYNNKKSHLRRMNTNHGRW